MGQTNEITIKPVVEKEQNLQEFIVDKLIKLERIVERDFKLYRLTKSSIIKLLKFYLNHGFYTPILFILLVLIFSNLLDDCSSMILSAVACTLVFVIHFIKHLFLGTT